MRPAVVRRARALLGALTAMLLVAVGLVLGAAPAHACSCAPLGRAEQVASADAVLSGSVRRIAKGDGSRGQTVTMTVAADRWYRGTARREVEITTAVSSAACGLGALGVGTRFVFFATESSGALYANSCGGSGRATPELLAEVTAATGPGAVPGTGGEPDGDTRGRDDGSAAAPDEPVRRTLVAAQEEPPGVLGLVGPGAVLAVVGLLGLVLLPLLRTRRR